MIQILIDKIKKVGTTKIKEVGNQIINTTNPYKIKMMVGDSSHKHAGISSKKRAGIQLKFKTRITLMAGVLTIH